MGEKNPMPLCILEITVFYIKSQQATFSIKTRVLWADGGERCLMGTSQRPSGNSTKSRVEGCVSTQTHLWCVYECVSCLFKRISVFFYFRADAWFLPGICVCPWLQYIPYTCVCVYGFPRVLMGNWVSLPCSNIWNKPAFKSSVFSAREDHY